MTQYDTNEEFPRSIRQQIVTTAQAMLDGKLSFLLGSRVLAPLRPQSDEARYDPDFLVFVAIYSQTQTLPVSAINEHWGQHALSRLDTEIGEAEQWASTVGTNACRSLIEKFSEREPNK